ncbi:hypothetical protein NX79_05405, partial [Xanthomonas vasicola]
GRWVVGVFQGRLKRPDCVERAAPAPFAGHAVNPFMEARHAANGPAIGEDTAPDSWLAANEKQLTATNSLPHLSIG